MDGRAWSPRSSRVNPPGNVPFGAPTSSLGGGREERGRREEGGEEGGRRGEGRGARGNVHNYRHMQQIIQFYYIVDTKVSSYYQTATFLKLVSIYIVKIKFTYIFTKNLNSYNNYYRQIQAMQC